MRSHGWVHVLRVATELAFSRASYNEALLITALQSSSCDMEVPIHGLREIQYMFADGTLVHNYSTDGTDVTGAQDQALIHIMFAQLRAANMASRMVFAGHAMPCH